MRGRSRALELGGDSVLLVGHTVRYGAPPALPADTTALIGDAAERAQLAGRPLLFITDGESELPADALRRRLPGGSVLQVESVERGPDLAVVGFEAPPAAVAGDTVLLRIRIAAAESIPSDAELAVLVDGRVVARRRLEPVSPWETRATTERIALPPGGPQARVAVAIAAAADAEPRNDTASKLVRRGERMTALAVSTAPDVDFREIVRVLRGTLSLPTAARFRVAQARWIDDRGRPVSEAQVRSELGQAQVVLLHGDTAYFGSPRTAAAGALALVPTVADDAEWYLQSAPPSPLSQTLAALAFDSLPPVAIGRPGAGIALLEVRSGQRTERLGIIQDSVRRVIILPVRGTARWALRGGAAGDAFTSLWGSVFAVLSERPGSRFAVAAALMAPRELQPQRPVLASGVTGEAATASRVALRNALWPYLVLVALLCAEWLLRRRGGLR